MRTQYEKLMLQKPTEKLKTDVAIIGAGPAGTTCGNLLRKYDPSLEVCMLEREHFPRDHVGESLLPMVSNILDELGVWDEVEACGFPIKIGGTYRWGNTDQLWDFNFLPKGDLHPQVRPAQFTGQRKFTAFQVDRAVYDHVLATRAETIGCDIRYGTSVRDVVSSEDKVEALILDDGTEVVAKFYVDASGHSGILRRKMGVEIEEPSSLKNIAIWDYWVNAEWAVKLGIGGTRIQVMSIGYGWLWFIQIGDDRTSVGFVCPADYYKTSGKSPEELYEQAIKDEPNICSLLSHATREGKLNSTKDWSFIAKRMTGENWFLAGESQGFADPILSAGLTLTHTSAREVAYMILEGRRGGDMAWFREQYEARNERRIRQHIKFADYWYQGNGNFNQLREYVSTIASEAGLDMNGEAAFQWLGTGGFIDEDISAPGLATFRLDQVHQIGQRLSVTPPKSSLDGYNLFLLNLKGAVEVKVARFERGRIFAETALRREKKTLPLSHYFKWLIEGLKQSPQLEVAMPIVADAARRDGFEFDNKLHARVTESLEAMVRDGWVKRKVSDNLPKIEHAFPHETAAIGPNTPGR